MSGVASPVRIGILGFSDIARRRFIPAADRAGNAVVTAVGTRDAERLGHSLPGGGPFTVLSYEALLANPDVDLVYISVPNHLHERWTLNALEAGKHVLCEKPLGLSAASVTRMTDRARAKGLLLAENIAYLLHPVHERVRELIASGRIGRVRQLRAAFGFRLTDRENFRLDPLRGGGAVSDLACYPLSAARHFLSGGRYTFSGYAFERGGLNTGLVASGVTSADEGFLCSIGFEQQYECGYEIVGEAGSLRVERAFSLPPDRAALISLAAGGNKTSLDAGRADHFQLMIEKVADAVLLRREFASSYRDALDLSRLTEQLVRSCGVVRAREEA